MEPQTTERESNNGGGVGESNAGFLASCRDRLRSAWDGLGCAAAGLAGKMARVARDDPRRVAHSLKVGLALTLVSVFYYVKPLFNSWGDSTIWAVITVVFVMEFTVGMYTLGHAHHGRGNYFGPKF